MFRLLKLANVIGLAGVTVYRSKKFSLLKESSIDFYMDSLTS